MAGVVRTIFLKELLDTFRDRRTLIAMLGIPIVLYPALFILATQVTLVQESKISETISKVALTGEDAVAFRPWLEAVDKIELHEVEDPRAALDAGDLDAVVHADEGAQAAFAGDGTAAVTVYHDSTETNSRTATNRVEEALRKAREAAIQERIANEGLAVTFAKPIELTWENVAPPEKSTGSILGMILPLIIVVMLGVGAFYPAVDLTAGEKERGTFETLLSTPTSKLQIVFGKFLAVFTLSMLTGLLNLGSMIVTLLFQLGQIRGQLDNVNLPVATIAIPPQTIFAILIVLVPLSFFISAVMMTVALMARSFKEAQNYVSPFFILIVIPASAVALPGFELTETTRLLPIANVALLFRDLLVDKASVESIFIVFLTTAIYALIALVIAAWLFQREEVVLSEESGIPLTFKRDRIQPSNEPTLGLALGIFAAVMLLIFYIGAWAQGRNIHTGILITQYALILAPVLAALWYGKVDLRNTLNLHRPSNPAILGTLLTAPAWLILSIQLGVYHNKILPAPKEFAELAERLFNVANTPGGVIGMLLIIALSPAICEEVLFRGLLISGFRARTPKWGAILAVGILFGFFHLSIYKLIPTALTGIFFTYLVIRGGSIYLSIFAHLTLNGLSVLIETENVPQSIIQYLESNNIEQNGLPLPLLLAAFLTFILGIAILERSPRPD